jgi:hypothetical protein
MTFRLERKRTDKISRDAVLEELRRVAKHYNYRTFTLKEFNTVATRCKASTVLREFGSWENALVSIGASLAHRQAYRADRIPVEDLFSEMERIWSKVGQRPSRAQWEQEKPKFGYSTYYKRFNGWLNACAAFIDYKSGGTIKELEIFDYETTPDSNEEIDKNSYVEAKRDVPLRLRLQVLKRDRFSCALCGRSPATTTGVVLHIDHIVPFSKGGKTVFDNLRTLCQQCNWGKGAEYD